MSTLWIRFEKVAKPHVTKYHAFQDDNYMSMCKREVRKKSKGKQLKNKPKDNVLICSTCRNLA